MDFETALGSPVLRPCAGDKNTTQEKHLHDNLYRRNMLRAARPNCAISYDTPKRNRKPVLVPVRPKLGETLNVVPFASVQAIVGAR